MTSSNKSQFQRQKELVWDYLSESQQIGIDHYLEMARDSNDAKSLAYYEEAIQRISEYIGNIPGPGKQDGLKNKAVAYLRYVSAGSDFYVIDNDPKGKQGMFGYRVDVNSPYESEFIIIKPNEFLERDDPPELDLDFQKLTMAQVRMKYRIPANYYYDPDYHGDNYPEYDESEFYLDELSEFRKQSEPGRAPEQLKQNKKDIRNHVSVRQYKEICAGLQGPSRFYYERAISRALRAIGLIPDAGGQDGKGLEAVAVARYFDDGNYLYVIDKARNEKDGTTHYLVLQTTKDSCEFVYHTIDIFNYLEMDLNWEPETLERVRELHKVTMARPRKFFEKADFEKIRRETVDANVEVRDQIWANSFVKSWGWGESEEPEADTEPEIEP